MSDAKCILLIDDSDTVLTRLKARLIAEGYDVLTTMQTVGAARHLKRCDLVVIDYHMPGIDGKGVVDSLRAAAKAIQYCPMLYVYSSDSAVEKQYVKLGFDGAFTKKGDEDSLVQQISAAFRMHALKGLRGRPKY